MANHVLFNSKINVYNTSAAGAIDVFDAANSGTQPYGTILVNSGSTFVPGAWEVNVSAVPGAIGVSFVSNGDTPVPPTPPAPTWKTVKIGNQIWMAENLAVDDGGKGIKILDNVTVNDYNFGTVYYYTWDAAIRVSNEIEGWHLPTTAEYNELKNFVSGQDYTATGTAPLRITYGWSDGPQGTNETDFGAQPLGCLRPEDGYPSSPVDATHQVNFWTSNDWNSENAWSVFMYSRYPGWTNYPYKWKKINNSVVRLVKDNP